MINLRYNNGRINSAETPFKIPDTWMWVKLGDIADFPMGKTPSRNDFEYWEKNYPWVSIADLIDGEVINSTKEGVSEKANIEVFKNRISRQGTLLMSFKLTIGKVSILGMDAFHNEAIVSIFPFIDIEKNTTKYLYKVLPYLTTLTTDTKEAIKGKTLNSSSLYNLMIPLPPLAEQKRIVEKIEELEPLINRYGKASEELARIKSAFPEDLRNSILQQAVEGKLVPQNPADEPAGELLKRIKQERQQQIKEGKIKPSKLPKSNEPLNPADMPFKIPDSWIWQRLDNVGIYKKGPFGSSLTKGIFVEKSDNTVKVYEQKNAIYKDEKLGNYYITNDYFEQKMKGFEVFPGDIIVSCAGTIGETFVLPDNMEKGIINQALMKIKISNYIYVPYFLVYFDFIIKETSSNQSKGSAIKNIPPFDIFKQLPIPIPPLAEQKRIVKKIKDLDLLINNLFELIA